jgi:hypothetical protein
VAEISTLITSSLDASVKLFDMLHLKEKAVLTGH